MIRRGFRPFTPALVLSTVLHSAALGSALVWGPGEPSLRAASVVLVELPPSSDPVGVATGLPSSGPVEVRPPDASELARHVDALADANSELSARLEDERQRTAQLEARHRQELAALETAKQHLGEELAALAADRSTLAAEVEAERQRRATIEGALAARVQAETTARDELAATYDRLVRALATELEIGRASC